MESGLIFNQLICEFESRHPCQTLNKSWGHSLNENNHREVAKAVASYMPAPAMVRLCKPAQHRKVPFTRQRVEVTTKLA